MLITSPLKVNTGLTISLQLLFRKITILVFEALTYNFQVLQYKYMAFRADCNSMWDSAKITVVSNKYNFKYTDNSSVSRKICIALQIFVKPSYVCDINSTRSFKNNEKRTGDKFPPWRTPKLLQKNSDNWEPFLIIPPRHLNQLKVLAIPLN